MRSVAGYVTNNNRKRDRKEAQKGADKNPYSFPWATLAVNLAGSFLIGLFYAWSARFNLSPEVRLLLTTGLCGGFTTFSTFSNDCLQMVRQGYYAPFVLYACLSVGLGIAAVWAGSSVGR